MRLWMALGSVLCTPWLASAQIPSSQEILDRLRGGGVLMNFVMLEQPSVQQEIRATPEQVQRAKSLAETQRARLQGLSQMSRLDAVRTVGEVRSAADTGLQQIFSPSQLQRLREVGLQKSGPLIGLTQPDVSEKVALSMSQRDQLRTLQESLIARISGMSQQVPQSGLGRARAMLDMVREIQSAKQQADSQALALLTPDQQRSWTTLQGVKFEGETEFGGPLRNRLRR